MLTRIVAAAALAGVTAGLLLTGVQHFAVAPSLRAAEVYEDAAIAAPSPPSHAHAPAVPADPAWSPGEGCSRTLATALANVVLATGYALLLAAGMALRGAAGARAGLCWGIAGYFVFFVAPALGLPPELPGGAAAPLYERELWWVATVAATAAGLWLLAFGASPVYRLLGVIVLCAPQVAGAPLAPEQASAVPSTLVREFLYATYGVNAALWLVLGGLVGAALPKERRD